MKKDLLLTQWNKEKIKVERRAASPMISEGKIWWCANGENIGVEINGKGAQFMRPVLVFRKLNRNSFLAVPISTQDKDGSWYVKFNFKKQLRVAILAQIKIMSVYRLYNKMGELELNEMETIRRCLKGLYRL